MSPLPSHFDCCARDGLPLPLCSVIFVFYISVGSPFRTDRLPYLLVREFAAASHSCTAVAAADCAKELLPGVGAHRSPNRVAVFCCSLSNQIRDPRPPLPPPSPLLAGCTQPAVTAQSFVKITSYVGPAPRRSRERGEQSDPPHHDQDEGPADADADADEREDRDGARSRACRAAPRPVTMARRLVYLPLCSSTSDTLLSSPALGRARPVSAGLSWLDSARARKGPARTSGLKCAEQQTDHNRE